MPSYRSEGVNLIVEIYCLKFVSELTKLIFFACSFVKKLKVFIDLALDFRSVFLGE